MTPQRILIGQITVAIAIVITATSAATQWAVHILGYQTALGSAWFSVGATPISDPWRLYEWWYAFEAYAPILFTAAGTLVAAGGVLGLIAVVGGSLWRARQAGGVTTYGSSRWATRRNIERTGTLEPVSRNRFWPRSGPD